MSELLRHLPLHQSHASRNSNSADCGVIPRLIVIIDVVQIYYVNVELLTADSRICMLSRINSLAMRIVEQLTARELDPVNRQRQQVFTVVHCHHHAPVIRQNTFLRTSLIADRREYSACVKRHEESVDVT